MTKSKTRMFSILREKFQDPELHSKLLRTAGPESIEASSWSDKVWSVDVNIG